MQAARRASLAMDSFETMGNMILYDVFVCVLAILVSYLLFSPLPTTALHVHWLDVSRLLVETIRMMMIVV